MIGMSIVPSRITDGMLVCSGDVLLLFNALQIDFYSHMHGNPGDVDADGNSTYWELGAAALSIKENAETGKNHGVYSKDKDGNVGKFLHKQTVETLKENNAVDNFGNVDIDTGAVILSADMLNSLNALIATKESYHAFVNEKARLSFYADFLYPLASDAMLEQYYREAPEGDFTEELHFCRKQLWGVLHKYRMKLIQFSPASFIHFGTTKELLHLMTDGMEQYKFLGWESAVNANLVPEAGSMGTAKYAVSNSYISRRCCIGQGSYIEDSRIHRNSKVGENCVISGVTLTDEMVPDDTVLHVLKLNDGRFVCRIYGVNDNPKESRLFGKEIDEPLWTKKLYPVCDTVEAAVKSSLEVVFGRKEAGYRLTASGELTSLKDSFDHADVTAILPWQENLYNQIVAEAILDKMEQGVSADEVKHTYPTVNAYTVDYLMEKADKLGIEKLTEFSRKIRIYGYLYKITSIKHYSDRCFEMIAQATLKSCEESIKYNESLRLKTM